MPDLDVPIDDGQASLVLQSFTVFTNMVAHIVRPGE
jgi:hypothetical protein